MSTTLKILSYPCAEISSGITVVAPIVSWAFGDWKPIAKIITQDINIISLQFQVTNVPSADTTYEQLFEIGVNNGQGIVTKIQIPHSFRADTAVGFYQTPFRVFLPEPYTVYAGASIYVRAAHSVAAVVTYNSVHLFYQAADKIKPQSYSALPSNYQFVEVGNGLNGGGGIR